MDYIFIFQLVLSSIFFYLVGSIQFGIIISQLFRKIDIRNYGSGKTGTTNILRTLGIIPAMLVIFLDIFKGASPVLIGSIFFDDQSIIAINATFVVIGHCWPIFASFRGGRGVASAFGGFVSFIPIPAIFILIIGIIIIASTKYISLASIVTVLLSMICIIILIHFDYTSSALLLFAIPTGLLIEFNHIDNIKRLINGSESKLGQKINIENE
ncbi:MAG: glycerol-3-phosphate 1-O-acyltransferase PlsY [Dehalococcoidia bacterium]|jgi:glycerol-3-phosphate acyltransferase PlsY|nr:MAG: glycerol-3-phosphate acyltransferase PlsY [Chloroflexota bacterium]|tara:strand:+ start:2404 stop:3039 length:636 start_codon:yes stop_codon:yes gene_type:complete